MFALAVGVHTARWTGSLKHSTDESKPWRIAAEADGWYPSGIFIGRCFTPSMTAESSRRFF
jgi:hypothetical protein